MLVIDADQHLVGMCPIMLLLFFFGRLGVMYPILIARNLHLLGIMTDKDLAFRVIAEGLDIRSTIISQVMTRVCAKGLP